MEKGQRFEIADLIFKNRERNSARGDACVPGASEVSGIASLPAGALPLGVVPVSKTLFIDLLDPAFSLAATIPEKIEGLAWGPDLPDGRHLLYVMSDNDLNPSLATQIYAFAIDPALINLEPQNLSGPLYPPGQVKRR